MNDGTRTQLLTLEFLLALTHQYIPVGSVDLLHLSEQYKYVLENIEENSLQQEAKI